MGRVGAAGDNAAMESFFSLLQKNVLDRRSWATREELRIAIVTWLERTYHRRRRRQSALGRLTPIEFETIMTAPATQAACPNLSPVRAANSSALTRRCPTSRRWRPRNFTTLHETSSSRPAEPPNPASGLAGAVQCGLRLRSQEA